MTIRILLEIADRGRNENPEVAFYHYDEDATDMMDYQYSLFAASSEDNGRYDLLSEEFTDADGEDDIDKHERKLYLQLADAFAQFKDLQSRR